MKYLTLSADYSGFSIVDEIEGEISGNENLLPKDLIEELAAWNEKYKCIIPMEGDERSSNLELIEHLDDWGIQLSKRIESEMEGGAKIKYYSEGKLRVLLP